MNKSLHKGVRTEIEYPETCKKGHSYPENLYIAPGNGKISCRFCRKLDTAAYRKSDKFVSHVIDKEKPKLIEWKKLSVENIKQLSHHKYAVVR
jgi:hypothetical protein